MSVSAMHRAYDGVPVAVVLGRHVIGGVSVAAWGSKAIPNACLARHLASDAAVAHGGIATDAGRASFRAESAVALDGVVEFGQTSGERVGWVLGADPPSST